jgi:hypothetical protein
MRMSTSCGINNFFIRSIVLTVTNVLHNSAMKKGGILRYQSDISTKAILGDVFYILTVDKDAPISDIKEPEDETREGRFAAPRISHETNLLARFNNNRFVLKERFSAFIMKFNIFKNNLAFLN